MRGGVYTINGAGVTGAMRACSACAGDYEDPDRTAWTPDDAAEPEFGGFAVEKRQRAAGRILRGEDFGTVWEYQLKRAIRRKFAGARSQGGGRKLSLQQVAC